MSGLSGKPVRMEIASAAVHLPVVRGALERLCREIGFDDDAIGKVILSVDEALTNIIRHAYAGRDNETIHIELLPLGGGGPGGLRISLRDRGARVDPSRIKGRDLGDVRPGGLGVHIINECMDKVQYSDAPGGGTLLVLEKRLSKEAVK
jgi:anti-sigma regulatory factor (Ser/Thr protein kinase)